MKSFSSSIDLILVKCRYHFKHTPAFENGLSDFHKIVVTCFKDTYERPQPINIQYRSYKNFDRNAFLSDLQAIPFEEAHISPNSELAYEKFKMLCSEVSDKHAPLKHRVLRGSQAPFMTKDLSKQIMIRSRLRNKFSKHKTTKTGMHIKLSEINAFWPEGKIFEITFHSFVTIVVSPQKSSGTQSSPFLVTRVPMEMRTIHFWKIVN